MADPDDSCQVIFDLDFCDTVAYAVPSNTNLKLNDSVLAAIYEDQAKAYYENFTKSLQQIPCNATPDARYSLAQTCDDCAANYKTWLCSVLIPRCEDWTATDEWLQPRNIGSAFPNDSSMFGKDPMAQFNSTARKKARESVAYSNSRNPLIDEEIKPGPYKEMLPCEDLCFDIVRSCPAKMKFGCPEDEQRAMSYGKKDENPDQLTCSFPGAVVKLNAVGAASGLGVQVGSVVFVAAMVAVFGLV
jgi:calcium channel MID1